MASYYALRLFQHAMHNRKPEVVETRDVGWREGGIIAALVACIVALAVYPQVVLERSDDAVNETVSAFEQPSGASATLTPASQPHNAKGEARSDGRSDGEVVRHGVGGSVIARIAP
jgi:hypothetical protein